ncbi:MAG: hypothetical protein ACHQ01_07725 [Candidatus Limnocylindrales bacterium]
MRLSQWRKSAPTKESMSDRVLATLKPVLLDLGDDADPECWVAWGDDTNRYSVLAPTVAGLITVAVRLGAPEEGPRATGRLIRWPKLTVSELSVDASGGHRLVAVQVESLVLKGVNEEADRICEFVRELIASVDGRTAKPVQIAVAQGVPMKAVAAGPARKRVAAKPAAATPKRPAAAAPRRAAAAAARAAAASKPRSVPGPKVASTEAKPAAAATSRVAAAPGARARTRKPAPASSLGLVPLVQVPPQAAASVAAAATSRPVPPPRKPTPIAARAAAVQKGSGAAGKRTGKEAPEPEPDRPEWVSPHPIEEPPAHDLNRPRPWRP